MADCKGRHELELLYERFRSELRLLHSLFPQKVDDSVFADEEPKLTHLVAVESILELAPVLAPKLNQIKFSSMSTWVILENIAVILSYISSEDVPSIELLLPAEPLIPLDDLIKKWFEKTRGSNVRHLIYVIFTDPELKINKVAYGPYIMECLEDYSFCMYSTWDTAKDEYLKMLLNLFNNEVELARQLAERYFEKFESYRNYLL